MRRLKFDSDSVIDCNLEAVQWLTYPELSWEDFLLTLPNVIDAEWCSRNIDIKSHTILTFDREESKTWFLLRFS